VAARTNENTKGLLRQYFSKRADLRNYSIADLRRVEILLNNRPCKLTYPVPPTIVDVGSAPKGWPEFAVGNRSLTRSGAVERPVSHRPRATPRQRTRPA
jgi:hypothetical protein